MAKSDQLRAERLAKALRANLRRRKEDVALIAPDPSVSAEVEIWHRHKQH